MIADLVLVKFRKLYIYINYGFLLSDLYMDADNDGIATFSFGIVYGLESKFNKATYNSMKDWIYGTSYLKIVVDYMV